MDRAWGWHARPGKNSTGFKADILEIIVNKNLCQFLFALVMSWGALLSLNGHAQSANDHQHDHSTGQPAMTDGEVKKVDLDNGKVTIQHGDIAHLDMPAMTMAFAVRDKALLAHIQRGDQVRFMVIREGGKLLVTDIQPVR